MDTIKFANGAVYECSFLSTIPDGNAHKAFIALSDVSLVEAASIFGDEHITEEMEYGDYVLIDYKWDAEKSGLYMQPYGIQAVLYGGHDERRN